MRGRGSCRERGRHRHRLQSLYLVLKNVHTMYCHFDANAYNNIQLSELNLSFRVKRRKPWTNFHRCQFKFLKKRSCPNFLPLVSLRRIRYQASSSEQQPFAAAPTTGVAMKGADDERRVCETHSAHHFWGTGCVISSTHRRTFFHHGMMMSGLWLFRTFADVCF